MTDPKPIAVPPPPPPTTSSSSSTLEEHDDSGKVLVYTCIGACVLLPIIGFALSFLFAFVAINPSQRIREAESRRIQSEERQRQAEEAAEEARKEATKSSTRNNSN